MENNVREKVTRLENLKQRAIVKYCGELDLDDRDSIYEKILADIEEGFDSFYLEDKEDDEKKEIMELVSDYLKYCFYEEDRDNWLDSCENFRFSNSEDIMMNILDNCDFLVRLAIEGGKNSLEVLNDLVKNNFNYEASLVDHLRNTFYSDDVLVEIINRMGQENSIYNVFSAEEKNVLLDFPEGTLYGFDEDGRIILFNPILLLTEIASRRKISYGVSDELDVMTLELMRDIGELNEADFFEVVSKMSDDYRSNYNKTISMAMMFSKNDYKKDYWDVDRTPLGEFVDTPYNPRKR